jgi:hypothetical protein
MANVNSARGLRLVGHLNGLDPQIRTYYKPVGLATACYVGDPVKSGSSADAAGEYADIALAAAGDVIRGVIVGFLPVFGTPTVNYSAASLAGYVRVCDDPYAIYSIQEDSVGNTIAATMIGNNAAIVVASGSATTGYSGTMLDSSTYATTDAALRILGVAPRPDNAIGTNAEILVMINDHEFKQTTGD